MDIRELGWWAAGRGAALYARDAREDMGVGPTRSTWSTVGAAHCRNQSGFHHLQEGRHVLLGAAGGGSVVNQAGFSLSGMETSGQTGNGSAASQRSWWRGLCRAAAPTWTQRRR